MRFVVGGEDFAQGLFYVPVLLNGVVQFCEVCLDRFPVIVVLGGDVDAVAFGGFVGLFVQEEFLVELFAGTQARADDLFLAGAVEADHLFCQVFDFDGLAHVQDEELPAFGDGDRLEDQGGGFGDGHEVADDPRVGEGHRAAGPDLALEDRDHGAVGAQDVAEADGHELGFVVRDRGDDDLRQALGGAHDVGGVHGLVRGDEDKALHVAFHGDLRGFVCAEDVVQDRLLGGVLHEGHMLVGGGVDHDVGFVFAHDPPEGFLVPDGADLEDHGIGNELPVLLLQFKEEVVHVVLGDVVEDELFRGKGQDLAAQFRSDGSAPAGDHHGPAGEVFLDLGHVQVLFRPAQEVRDVDLPGFRALPGAGVQEHVGVGGKAAVQKLRQVALRGGDGDDDLVNAVFFDGGLDLVRGARHGNPGNGGALCPGIVVQDGYRDGVAVAAVLDIPDHGRAGVAGADDQYAFGVLVRFFVVAGFPVADQEAGAGDQEEGDDPLDEIDRAGHQDPLGAGLIALDEQGNHQGNQVGDAGAGQGADDRLEEGVNAGIAQDGFIDPRGQEGQEGGNEEQGNGPGRLDQAGLGNLQGKVEGDGKKQAGYGEQRVQGRPEEFLFHGAPSSCGSEFGHGSAIRSRNPCCGKSLVRNAPAGHRERTGHGAKRADFAPYLYRVNYSVSTNICQ